MNKEVGWCEELNKSDKWGFYATDFPKCPHCGYEHQDCCDCSYVFEEGEHKMYCSSCDNEFTVSTFVSFTFSTDKQEVN